MPRIQKNPAISASNQPRNYSPAHAHYAHWRWLVTLMLGVISLLVNGDFYISAIITFFAYFVAHFPAIPLARLSSTIHTHHEDSILVKQD